MLQPRAHGSSKTLRWWVMALPTLPTFLYALNFAFGTTIGTPSVQARILASTYGWCHVIGGGIAILLGPFQFLDGLRRQRPWIHRWVGRVYVAAVFVGGYGGLHGSLYVPTYPIGNRGFAALAIAWLATVVMGVFTIWNGDVPGHREWMIRNFSLTYSAVMLRWHLVLLIVSGMTPEGALTVTAFSCWIPNSVFAEWYVRKGRSRKMAVE